MNGMTSLTGSSFIGFDVVALVLEFLDLSGEFCLELLKSLLTLSNQLTVFFQSNVLCSYNITDVAPACE